MPNPGIGYLAAGIAVICFGSNFVPVKKYETGDGMFFQWVLCSAIWMSGFFINLIRTNFSNGLVSSVVFYPYAMLGGAMWCLGNASVVTIIRCIGLGLGMCIWGSVNLIFGWASGAFGLFGLKEQRTTLAHPILNYVGAVTAVIGVFIFLFVKPSTSNPTSKNPQSQEAKFLLSDPYRVNEETPVQSESFVDSLSEVQKRVLGIFLASVSGFFYGINFNPPQYIVEHTTDTNGLDYVFSHFCGIFITSTFIMIIYCIIKKNKPVLFPEAVLPAIVSGIVWSIAQICWFIANSNLELVVTFPLLSTGPAIVANMWGILVFKEITGIRNFLILGLAFFFIILAIILIVLSNLHL